MIGWLCSLAYTVGCFFTISIVGTVSAFLDERRYKIRVNAVLIITLIIVYTNCLFDTVLSGTSALITVGLYLLHYITLAICCFVQCGKGKLKRAIYLLLTFLSINSLFEEITKLIIGGYTDIKGRFYFSWMLFMAFSLLDFLIVKLLLNKDLTEVRINIKTISNKIYLLILLNFFVAGGLVSIQATNTFTNKSTITKVLSVLFILISIIILFTTFSSVVSKNYYERQSALFEHQIESELCHYERIGVLDSELRTFRHDYKNHMLCIRCLIIYP